MRTERRFCRRFRPLNTKSVHFDAVEKGRKSFIEGRHRMLDLGDLSKIVVQRHSFFNENR